MAGLRVAAVMAFFALAGAVAAGELAQTRNPGTFMPKIDTAQAWTCQPRRTCGRIRSCDEAYWYLYNCSWGVRLDGDDDGVPCETICGRR